MAIQINIRDVPEKVRDELAARAALQGKSMQEFCAPNWSDWLPARR
jgi:plasmid stability protein